MKNLSIAVLSAIIFFVVAFLTIQDYGISWDETLHFRRGQAYLHYFFTGKLDYRGLTSFNFQGTGGKPENITSPRRSFYQNDFHNGYYFMRDDTVGHPALNDELAALSNYLFFKKLGWLDDITAYHIFNIFTSSILVFTVTIFALNTFGKFAAVISSLSLSTYPLFWAESHFNIKDPPEAAFFAMTIWSFWMSLKKGSWRWLLLAILSFSFALGTKFNIIFLPLILLPYLLIRFYPLARSGFSSVVSSIVSLPRAHLMLLIFSPFIVISILIVSWPYLWGDPLNNLLRVFGYYSKIGAGTQYQPESFYFWGVNTFPLQWILFTTPPPVLLLTFFGIISSWINRHKLKNVTLLWLLWLIVPIARVSFPGASVYGGIRQILEFLPALALLAGLGGWQLLQWLNKIFPFIRKRSILSVSLLTIMLFAWPVFVLVKMHPNENVYFNFLIGGLRGAYAMNFPSWGNSFGNAYYQGVKWLNNNTEKNAKLSLIQGTSGNVPIIWLRPDIDYNNKNFSGVNRRGEYIMELTFNDTGKAYYDTWEYVDKFLVPVYELRVDDVAILKIWKNDLAHTR